MSVKNRLRSALLAASVIASPAFAVLPPIGSGDVAVADPEIPPPPTEPCVVTLYDEFTFIGYTAATRTLRWEADEVTKDGSLTYQATIDEGAAELQQPLTNTACISSDDTEEDCDPSDVFVNVPPQAETAVPHTAPPTDTVAGDEASASGPSILLVLMALAGIALAVFFVAPTPASIRKRR